MEGTESLLGCAQGKSEYEATFIAASVLQGRLNVECEEDEEVDCGGILSV